MSKILRRTLLLGLAAVFTVALVIGPAAAKDVNVTGSVMCGKCTLKKADLKDCQDMLVVKEGDTGEVRPHVQGREEGQGRGRRRREGRQDVADPDEHRGAEGLTG